VEKIIRSGAVWLCSSPNADRMMTSSGVRRRGCKARVEEKNATVLVGET